VKLRSYSYKLTIFLSARADKSICGTIELCFDVKHSDPNVWAFARRIALFGTKLSPICTPGTLTPKRLVHVFAFDSKRIYINLAATATASLLLPGASCPPLLPLPTFCCSLLIVIVAQIVPIFLTSFVVD
jgi:hypothetical protein